MASGYAVHFSVTVAGTVRHFHSVPLIPG